MKNLGSLNSLTVIVIMILSIIILSSIIDATPFGPTKLINVSTSTKNVTSAGPKSRADLRSTITIVRMNVSQQTSKWKAYVGNITGKITLDDAKNYTIYDWTMSGAAGEVYATRSSTIVNWNTVACASIANVESEQGALKHGLAAADTLNRTFRNYTHGAFYAGPTLFQANQCKKTADLYRADVPNANTWHEVLLWDGSNLVYTSIINASRQGYNSNQYYDFQMIVAENGSEGSPAVNTYYFYVEIT